MLTNTQEEDIIRKIIEIDFKSLAVVEEYFIPAIRKYKKNLPLLIDKHQYTLDMFDIEATALPGMKGITLHRIGNIEDGVMYDLSIDITGKTSYKIVNV